MKFPKAFGWMTLWSIGVFMSLTILGLFIEKLVDKRLDSIIAALNIENFLSQLSFLRPHMFNLFFAIAFVIVWAWLREGWRPFGSFKKMGGDPNVTEDQEDDAYPLKDDLIELNKLVRTKVESLRGLGVLANLHVVKTDILNQRLLSGLKRHEIPHPPLDAGNDVWYQYLIGLDDPTHRGKITESRRVVAEYSDAPAIPSTQINGDSPPNDSCDHQNVSPNAPFGNSAE